MIHLTIMALTGIVATGPYIYPIIGMLNTICIQRINFLSVDAFIVIYFILRFQMLLLTLYLAIVESC